MYLSNFTEPNLLIFPKSFRPKSTSMLCSAHSFGSANKPRSNSKSSSFDFPLGLVPANGNVKSFLSSNLTKVSGEAPATSMASPLK